MRIERIKFHHSILRMTYNICYYSVRTFLQNILRLPSLGSDYNHLKCQI